MKFAFTLVCFLLAIIMISAQGQTTTFKVQITPAKGFPNQPAFKAALDSCTITVAKTKDQCANASKVDVPVMPNVFGTTFVPYLIGNNIIAEVTVPGDVTFDVASDYVLCACNGVFDTGNQKAKIKEAISTDPDQQAAWDKCFAATSCGASVKCRCGPGIECTSDDQCLTGKCTQLESKKSCEADHLVSLEFTFSGRDGIPAEIVSQTLTTVSKDANFLKLVAGFANLCIVTLTVPRTKIVTDADGLVVSLNYYVQPMSLVAPNCNADLGNADLASKDATKELAAVVKISSNVISEDVYPLECIIPGGGFFCAVVPQCEFMECIESDFTTGIQCENAEQCAKSADDADSYTCVDGICVNSAFSYSVGAIMVALFAVLLF